MLSDNGTTYANARHVYKSDFSGNLGKDCCLEMFGEQDEDCVAYNKSKEYA